MSKKNGLHVTRRTAALMLGATAFGVTGAQAQAWPSKPIRVIVPFGAGGVADVTVRLVTERLADKVGQRFVIENQPGPGGIAAARSVLSAGADGHTLALFSNGTAVSVNMFKDLRFDPLKDFAPITLIAEAPFLLVVHPAMPVKTIADLIAVAKAKPDSLTYGSGGVGSSGQMAGELFKYLAGVKLIHVPYKGAGPALIDVIGGQVNMTFGSVISSLGHVRSGKLKTLGVTSAKRARALPDIPTIAEAGVKGYSTTTWYGALAPAHTPAGVVQKLNAEIRKALTAPEVGEHMSRDGAEPVGSSPQQFHEFLSAEMTKWRDLVKNAGVRVE